MKSMLMTVFVGLLLACSNRAASATELTETNEVKTWSGEFTSLGLSRYVFPETGEVLHDKPVLQSEIAIESLWGFYASIWHSTGFDRNLSGDGGDEIDYYLGWAGDAGPLSLDVGFSYYDSVELFRGATDDTFYLYARVGKTFSYGIGELTPFVKGNLFINGDNSEVEGGTIISAGLEYEPKLPFERLSLPLSFQVSYDDGAFGANNGLISRLAAEASWKVHEQVSIRFPVITVNVPLTVNDYRETEVVFGGGVSINF